MIEVDSRWVPEENQGKVICRHHWIIESAAGRVSNGVCRICDEFREFKNYVEQTPWMDDEDTPLADVVEA